MTKTGINLGKKCRATSTYCFPQSLRRTWDNCELLYCLPLFLRILSLWLERCVQLVCAESPIFQPFKLHFYFIRKSKYQIPKPEYSHVTAGCKVTSLAPIPAQECIVSLSQTLKQVLLYNLIGCIHLKKDINQWVFPLWRQKGLFHRREGINRLVQGTLCELSYTVYLRGKKKVIFFLLCRFWQRQTKQPMFSQESEGILLYLENTFEDPPAFVQGCECCLVLLWPQVPLRMLAQMSRYSGAASLLGHWPPAAFEPKAADNQRKATPNVLSINPLFWSSFLSSLVFSNCK